MKGFEQRQLRAFFLMTVSLLPLLVMFRERDNAATKSKQLAKHHATARRGK